MAIERMLAQMTVADADTAVPWYERLLGSAPDATPMDGLYEWHLAPTFGVQVWVEPERAGSSSMVLDDTDLDGRAAALDAAGIAHDGIQEATSLRVLQLDDPDGNRIVFTGPLPH